MRPNTADASANHPGFAMIQIIRPSVGVDGGGSDWPPEAAGLFRSRRRTIGLSRSQLS
jgi:hypothetical protein